MEKKDQIEPTKIIPYTAKVVKNGNSLHIRVPAFLKDINMEIEKGDFVEVQLKVLKKNTDKRLSPDQVTKPINFKGEVQ